MSFSAYCPIASLDEVRQLLDGQGFGPENFSVPLRDGIEAATHAGCYAWGPQEFRQALEDLPVELGVVVHDSEQQEPPESFGEMVTTAALDWSDPLDADNPWFVNPVMIGDERTHGGKTWVSLINYNVWTPPIGWREVVEDGYPAWVQPTGAQDAYAIGDRVTHNGNLWECVQGDASGNNSWEPGVFGWVEVA